MNTLFALLGLGCSTQAQKEHDIEPTEDNALPGDMVVRESVDENGNAMSDYFGYVLDNFDSAGQQRCLSGKGYPIQKTVDAIKQSNRFVCSNDPAFAEDVFVPKENFHAINLAGNAVDGYCHVSFGQTECDF